jgi:hypothetical protein
LGKKTGTREIYLKKIEAQLDEWQEEIEDLKTDTYRTQAETQIERTEQVEALRRQRRTAWNQLQTLNEASDETWGDLKTEVENKLYSLRKALDELSEQPQ